MLATQITPAAAERQDLPPLQRDHEATRKAFAQLPCADVLEAQEFTALWSPGPRSAFGDILGPCQHSRDRIAPPHRGLPITDIARDKAIAFATECSGLAILKMPKLCVPEKGDWGISFIMDRHYHAENLQFDRGQIDKEAVRAQSVAQAENRCLAMYEDISNTILFHPETKIVAPQGEDFLEQVIVYAHELIHAAQAQNFPELFAQTNKMNEQTRVLRGARSTPISILMGVWTHWSAYRALVPLIQDVELVRLLTEGHAHWVESLFREAIFTEISHNEHQDHSLLSSLKTWLHPHHLTASVFSAGRNMITAVEALQQELEGKPFVNAAGIEVTLDPALTGHGLTHLLFRNPEMVRQLLPNYQTAWRRALRERADVAPLRRFVLSLPGHVPFVGDSGTPSLS